MSGIVRDKYVCNTVIPLVFSESTSYLEIIDKLITDINGVITNINGYMTDKNDYVDAEIVTLKQFTLAELEKANVKIQKAYSDMTALTNQIAVENASYKLEVESLILSKFDAFRVLVQNAIHYTDLIRMELKDEIAINIANVYNVLDEIVQEGFNMHNPFNGKVESLSAIINMIYETNRINAFTCWDYDICNLSVTEYQALDLSAYEIDWNLKWHIDYEKFTKVFSPFTGFKVTIQNAINLLADLHKDTSLTASTYDSLNLTAISYDTKNVTANDYDWNSKLILI